MKNSDKNLSLIHLIVGQMAANCYILFDKITRDAMIIDPGDDEEYIFDTIIKENLNPKLIALTHGHFDHCLAACFLEVNFSISTYIHQKDLFLLHKMKDCARFYLKRSIENIPPQNLKQFTKDSLKLGNQIIRIIHTPGHTPGGICLFVKTYKSMVFSGDLLFAHGLTGRTDFSYSDTRLMHQSLRKIFNLAGDTIIYPGHGEKSTILIEKSFHDLHMKR